MLDAVLPAEWQFPTILYSKTPLYRIKKSGSHANSSKKVRKRSRVRLCPAGRVRAFGGLWGVFLHLANFRNGIHSEHLSNTIIFLFSHSRNTHASLTNEPRPYHSRCIHRRFEASADPKSDSAMADRERCRGNRRDAWGQCSGQRTQTTLL